LLNIAAKIENKVHFGIIVGMIKSLIEAGKQQDISAITLSKAVLELKKIEDFFSQPPELITLENIVPIQVNLMNSQEPREKEIVKDEKPYDEGPTMLDQVHSMKDIALRFRQTLAKDLVLLDGTKTLQETNLTGIKTQSKDLDGLTHKQIGYFQAVFMFLVSLGILIVLVPFIVVTR
jgi:hypothetical protein